MGVEDVRKMERYLTKNYISNAIFFEKPTCFETVHKVRRENHLGCFQGDSHLGCFQNPLVNNGINYISTGAGSLPSTVWLAYSWF